jgi:hypothetical protein
MGLHCYLDLRIPAVNGWATEKSFIESGHGIGAVRGGRRILRVDHGRDARATFQTKPVLEFSNWQFAPPHVKSFA